MKLPKTAVRVEAGLSADAQIEQQFRQMIFSGEIAPGSKLPPTPELARQWKVSCTVVQKAMTKLAASGFIERRPRQGTFIKLPTDQSVVGLLFGPSLTDETAYYYRAILRAFREQAGEFNWTCRAYEGLTGTRGLPLAKDAEVVRQLREDLRNHAFKGLIEIAPGVRGLGEWEREAQLPKVIYEQPPAQTDLELDLAQFTAEAVKFLAQRGCKNLLYLRASWHLSTRSADLTGLFDTAASLRLAVPQVESFLITEQGTNMESEIFAKAQQLLDRKSTRLNSSHRT